MAQGKKTEWTKQQRKDIGEYALQGCQVLTIAKLIDIPEQTLRDNFGGFMQKKRAERKLILRKAQTSKAVDGKDTGMLCFLGKNELEQADKQEFKHSGQVSLLPPQIGKNG